MHFGENPTFNLWNKALIRKLPVIWEQLFLSLLFYKMAKIKVFKINHHFSHCLLLSRAIRKLLNLETERSNPILITFCTLRFWPFMKMNSVFGIFLLSNFHYVVTKTFLKLNEVRLHPSLCFAKTVAVVFFVRFRKWISFF